MTSSTRNSSHVLLTLGVLFTLGGVTRFIPNPAAAAQAGPEVSEPVDSAAMDAKDEVAAPDLGTDVCLSPETTELILEDQWLFEEQREALRSKDVQLRTWQADLDAETARLQALQQALDTRWQDMQAAADSDIEHLASMYGAMKPDRAALIFNQMDAGFAAGFLRELTSEQAGLILASMDSGKAYVVSVKLAARNQDIRTAARQDG